MDSKQFYSQILGISTPWNVTGVNLDIAGNKVEVFVTYSGGAGTCKCGTIRHMHAKSPERKWRHLDTCQLLTIIVCSLPRVKCPSCNKTETIQGSWSTPNSGFTLLFENLVIEWLLACQNQSSVSKQLSISFDEINGIMSRALDRGLERRKLGDIAYLSIDDKSMKKGHHYLTVLTDTRNSVVLDVCQTRTASAVIDLLDETLSYRQRRKVEAITMDMWDPYIKAAKTMLPAADIVHDRFHISKLLNDAVDITRRQELKKLEGSRLKAMKKSKFLWLSNFDSLTEDASIRFMKAVKSSRKVAEVWTYKEAFRAFFDCKDTGEAQRFIDKWHESATKTSFSALQKVAKTILRYSQGIVNYIPHKITNALAESINAKIQLLKAKARGFYSFSNYRRNILFYFGGLELSH